MISIAPDHFKAEFLRYKMHPVSHREDFELRDRSADRKGNYKEYRGIKILRTSEGGKYLKYLKRAQLPPWPNDQERFWLGKRQMRARSGQGGGGWAATGLVRRRATPAPVPPKQTVMWHGWVLNGGRGVLGPAPAPGLTSEVFKEGKGR